MCARNEQYCADAEEGPFCLPNGSSGQQTPVMYGFCFFSVGALWVRAPGHAAGGALYIITHMLGRQIHFVNKGKGQALIRQP